MHSEATKTRGYKSNYLHQYINKALNNILDSKTRMLSFSSNIFSVFLTLIQHISISVTYVLLHEGKVREKIDNPFFQLLDFSIRIRAHTPFASSCKEK